MLYQIRQNQRQWMCLFNPGFSTVCLFNPGFSIVCLLSPGFSIMWYFQASDSVKWKTIWWWCWMMRTVWYVRAPACHWDTCGVNGLRTISSILGKYDDVIAWKYLPINNRLWGESAGWDQWIPVGRKAIAWIYRRADSRVTPSQWETPLLCNGVSHWLGANLESALCCQLVPIEHISRGFYLKFKSFCSRKSVFKWCLQTAGHSAQVSIY